MSQIELSNVITPTGVGVALPWDGAPESAQSAVFTFHSTASGGSFDFTISVNGGAPVSVTNLAAADVAAATLQSAVRTALGNTGATASGGPFGSGDIVLTFSGAQANVPVAIVVDDGDATGGDVTVATTTVGQTGTYAGRASKGAMLNDRTNGALYVNRGTLSLPLWDEQDSPDGFPQPAITHLTVSTGGTPTSTLAALTQTVTGVDGTGSNAASKSDVDARLTVLANSISSVATKLNTLLGELETAGVLTAP